MRLRANKLKKGQIFKKVEFGTTQTYKVLNTNWTKDQYGEWRIYCELINSTDKKLKSRVGEKFRPSFRMKNNLLGFVKLVR